MTSPTFSPADSAAQRAIDTRYRRAFWLALAVVVVFYSLVVGLPVDDGLRHVGLAFGEARSWAEVYPYSVFAAHPEVQPWLGYDLTLRGLAALVGTLPISPLVQRLLLVRLLIAAFVGALLVLGVRRARLLDHVQDAPRLFLALIIVSVVALMTMQRIALIRPFAFGTLFLIYSVGSKGLVRGALAGAVLNFLYLYLGWIYALPTAVAHLLRGSRSYAAGLIAATVVALGLQTMWSPSFWQLLWSVFGTQRVRADVLKVEVSEFAPLFEHLAVAGFFLGMLLLLMPRFSAAAKRLRTEHLLMIFFAPLSIIHMRYFVDVQLCLLLVAFGGETLRVLDEPFRRVTSYWRGVVGSIANRPSPSRSRSQVGRGRLVFRLVLAAGYLAALVAAGAVNIKPYAQHLRYRDALKSIPGGSLVLTEFNLQYMLLYLRPDLRLVPSCEVAFFDPAIKAEYVSYLQHGDVCGLARKIDADFFVEARQTYLDPRKTRCLQHVIGVKGMNIWRVRR
jgi:hypothetical protein